MSFQGKHAVVTGAAGGMGLNIALDLLKAGAKVTMLDIQEAPPAIEGQEGLRYCQGDITDEGYVTQSIESAYQTEGRLDYLVNAAGVLWFGRDESLVDIDLDIWRRVIDIDLNSMVLTCRAAVPLMKASGGGAMVHFSTVQCLRGDDRPQDAYQAAKAGMIALSKSLAIQFAGDGIRSNCILPGGTESPMQSRWEDDPDLRDKAASFVPLGRLGRTEDMANAALFLLSDKASYITGTELIVDGGITALP